MSKKEPVKLGPIRKTYIWGTEDWLLSYLHPGFEEIPLLIKEITAREPLSVQVHPGDGFAWEQERSRGKTEMWYVNPDKCQFYNLFNFICLHKITPVSFF